MSIEQFIAMIEQYKQDGKDIDALLSGTRTLAAAGKTPLGLKQWVKSDKPMMEDFNEDNRIVDETLRELAAGMQTIRERPQEFPLPLKAGIMQRSTGNCAYSKDAFGRGYVLFSIQTEPYRDVIETVTIATLPPGYRPAIRTIGACAGYNAQASSSRGGSLQVATNGDIVIQFLGEKMAAAFGEISFWAEA